MICGKKEVDFWCGWGLPGCNRDEGLHWDQRDPKGVYSS